MKFNHLNEKRGLDTQPKIASHFEHFQKLIQEIDKKEVAEASIDLINTEIDAINRISEINRILVNQIRKSRTHILRKIEKDHKLVLKGHHRNTWFILGMSVFGLPLGVAFGSSQGNMGLLGIGMPIGMAMGMAVGAGLDKKAAEEGRQLDLESKF